MNTFEIVYRQFKALVTITNDNWKEEDADVVLFLPTRWRFIKIPLRLSFSQMQDLQELCRQVGRAVQPEP